jgi:hypothetical protein
MHTTPSTRTFPDRISRRAIANWPSRGPNRAAIAAATARSNFTCAAGAAADAGEATPATTPSPAGGPGTKHPADPAGRGEAGGGLEVRRDPAPPADARALSRRGTPDSSPSGAAGRSSSPASRNTRRTTSFTARPGDPATTAEYSRSAAHSSADHRTSVLPPPLSDTGTTLHPRGAVRQLCQTRIRTIYTQQGTPKRRRPVGSPQKGCRGCRPAIPGRIAPDFDVRRSPRATS